MKSWFPLALTGLFLSKRLSRVFSSTTIWKPQFFGVRPSLWSNSYISMWLLEKPWLWLYGPLLAKWCLCFLIPLGLSWEGNGTPLQYSCLENPMDRGAWWAAVYGVAQSRTWLKQLSSSNSMYGCESWTIKKAGHWIIDAFELWCWRRLLGVPWTALRSNQSILKEISSEYSLEGLTLKL